MASLVAKAIRRPGVAKAPAEKAGGSPAPQKGDGGAAGRPSRLNQAIAKMRGK